MLVEVIGSVLIFSVGFFVGHEYSRLKLYLETLYQREAKNIEGEKTTIIKNATSEDATITKNIEGEKASIVKNVVSATKKLKL